MTRAGLIALNLVREVPVAALCTVLAKELIGASPPRFASMQAGLLGWSTGHLVLLAAEGRWEGARFSPTTMGLSLAFTVLAAVSLQAVARPSQPADSS